MISEATWQTARHAADWRPPEGMMYTLSVYPTGDALAAVLSVGNASQTTLLVGGMERDDVRDRLVELATCLLEQTASRPIHVTRAMGRDQ